MLDVVWTLPRNSAVQSKRITRSREQLLAPFVNTDKKVTVILFWATTRKLDKTTLALKINRSSLVA